MRYYFIRPDLAAFKAWIKFKDGNTRIWWSKDYGRKRMENYNPRAGFASLVESLTANDNYTPYIECFEIYDKREGRDEVVRRWHNYQWEIHSDLTF
ncbi:MAG: hypothetical protein H6581_20550 [Bacteroidia bacterium]|nr:hypothetical protein [Bacteroidia bacterium]